MAWEHREGQGSFFNNGYKRTDDQPDLTGEIMINGVVYKLFGRHKTAQSGKKYISISAVKKDDPPAQTTDINPTKDEILF